MSFKFNKFMKDILQREEKQQVQEVDDKDCQSNSAREYRQRYAELWQNRIVWGKKDEKRNADNR